MAQTHSFLSALLGALLGVLVVLFWIWDNPREHVWLLVIVAVASGILSYAYGEQFTSMICRMLPGQRHGCGVF
ncbi:MAG: hypothetical protein EAZ30_16685 [Betaproteobacteria bacterium]|nr:MAG: hypothetical protein EAZ30_16685 [Betaproteobacteria bacterium]